MFSSKRFICSQLEWLPKGFFTKVNSRHYTAPDSGLGVVIPKRIERGPTDILKTLSKTVGRDPTAFHYKYPDDPYFYPLTLRDKRNLALSIESGRKSAKWIFDTYPDLFKSKIADPMIKEFIPQTVVDENTEVTEDMLVEAIKNVQVTDAINMYDTLVKKDISVSDETKQILLELVCYYNCNEKTNDTDLEFRWFRNEKTERVKSWLDDGFAEKLFQTMNQDCPLALSAIIQGRLKYNQVDKGEELYKAARQKGIKLTVGVYNNLLAQVFSLTETFRDRWSYMENLLEEMKNENIYPNVRTLNAILKLVCHPKNRTSKILAKQVVDEFTRLGIEPSLGSYRYLIPVLCRVEDDSFSVATFRKIIDDLKKVDLSIRDPSDMLFFPFVMYFCSKILKNSECARLLHGLLTTGDNVKFLSGNSDEGSYYREYLGLIFQIEPIEDAMEVYRNLVPNTYSLDPFLVQTCLSAIKRWETLDVLPEIWGSMQSLRIVAVEALKSVLELVALYKDTHGDKVRQVFLEAANNILTSLTESENLNFHLQQVDPPLVHYAVQAFIVNDDVKSAMNFFQKIQDGHQFLEVESATVKSLLECCLAKKQYSLALECLRYAEKKNYAEVQEMAAGALPQLTGVSESDLEFVKRLAEKKESEA